MAPWHIVLPLPYCLLGPTLHSLSKSTSIPNTTLSRKLVTNLTSHLMHRHHNEDHITKPHAWLQTLLKICFTSVSGTGTFTWPKFWGIKMFCVLLPAKIVLSKNSPRNLWQVVDCCWSTRLHDNQIPSSLWEQTKDKLPGLIMIHQPHYDWHRNIPDNPSPFTLVTKSTTPYTPKYLYTVHYITNSPPPARRHSTIHWEKIHRCGGAIILMIIVTT